MLFSRVDHSSAPRIRQATETLFEFCERLDEPTLNAGREIVNSWFDRFPIEARRELEARLRSRRDTDHYSAVFELQLFSLLREKGLEVVPVLHDVYGSRPDFALDYKGNREAFIEATVRLPGDDDHFFTFLQQTTQLVLRSAPRLRIWIHEVTPGEGNLVPRRFAAFLLREFEQRTQDTRLDELSEPKHLDELKFSDQGGWQILFKLILWHTDQAPRSTIAIANPVQVEWSRAVEILREKIEGKRKQHRGIELPLYVAISWHDPLHDPDEEEVVRALSGDGPPIAPLGVPGLILAPAATVWRPQPAQLTLWCERRHIERPLARLWPFALWVYDADARTVVARRGDPDA